jgi:hypothetical protein
MGLIQTWTTTIEDKYGDLKEEASKAFGGVFSPINDLFEKLFNFGDYARKGAEPLLRSLFEKFRSLLGDFSNVANELLSKSEVVAKGLIDQTIQGLSRLRAEVEKMVGNILITAQNTVEEIIKSITVNLINPFFKQVDNLRKRLVEDVKEIIDKVDTIVTGTIDSFRETALQYLSLFPWDVTDDCRSKLNIQGVPGPHLGTVEIYELLKCRRLQRFDSENEVKNLTVKALQTLYAELQNQAWHLACAARGSLDSSIASGAKTEAIEDWIEFGKLYKLWNQFEENMSILDVINTKIDQLDTRIAEIESTKSLSPVLESGFISKSWITNEPNHPFVSGVPSGDRSDTIHIDFTTGKFITPPKVIVVLSAIEVDHTVNTRLGIGADKITTSGFDIQVGTWADSRVYSAGISWFAYLE